MSHKPGILQTEDGKSLKVWYTEDGEWVEVEHKVAEESAWEYALKTSQHQSLLSELSERCPPSKTSQTD